MNMPRVAEFSSSLKDICSSGTAEMMTTDVPAEIARSPRAWYGLQPGHQKRGMDFSQVTKSVVWTSLEIMIQNLIGNGNLKSIY